MTIHRRCLLIMIRQLINTCLSVGWHYIKLVLICMYHVLFLSKRPEESFLSPLE